MTPAAARRLPITTLVVHTVEVPRTGDQVAREPADGAVRERDVPLVARPGARVPPLAGDTPRPRAPDHPRLGGERAADHRRPPLAVGGHAHAARRAEPAQR